MSISSVDQPSGLERSGMLPTARVLTIAGSDSGGGAGIQADLRTMAAYGVHGMSVIASVTVQNSLGVQGFHQIPLDVIEAQFRAVVDDIGVDAIKTGMLGDAVTIDLVANLLADVDVPVVIDPVCASKHGDPLILEDARSHIVTELAQRATVITPNLGEAALLSGLDMDADPADLAAPLLAAGAEWVLVKGGHAEGPPTDHLIGPGGRHSCTGERHDNRHTHGTGCTLAAAIASLLGLDHATNGTPDVPRAVERANAYVNGAIKNGFALGSGIGPVDHLWRVREHLLD